MKENIYLHEIQLQFTNFLYKIRLNTRSGNLYHVSKHVPALSRACWSRDFLPRGHPL